MVSFVVVEYWLVQLVMSIINPHVSVVAIPQLVNTSVVCLVLVAVLVVV